MEEYCEDIVHERPYRNESVEQTLKLGVSNSFKGWWD